LIKILLPIALSKEVSR